MLRGRQTGVLIWLLIIAAGTVGLAATHHAGPVTLAVILVIAALVATGIAGGD